MIKLKRCTFLDFRSSILTSARVSWHNPHGLGKHEWRYAQEPHAKEVERHMGEILIVGIVIAMIVAVSAIVAKIFMNLLEE